MRILRVAQKVYPDVKGGGPYHVHAMSRDQAAMGHDVTVLTLDGSEVKPHTEERDGYTVIRYPTNFSAFGNEISIGLASYLRQGNEFDVIHAHSHLYFSTNLAALKRALGGPPLAITNHGLYSQNAPKWMFNLYLRSLGAWTFNKADIVFCYSEEDKNRVRQLNVKSRIEVVHNGIDIQKFSPSGKESKEVIGDPSVLFVGRLVPGKRPADALKSFDRLHERFPDAGLTFCGEGPLSKMLEAEAKERGIESGVRFLGQVPYETMPEIYRAADILILPSRAEGLPRTILEAFATELPVVSSHLEHTAPVVKRGGKTVPVGDIQQYYQTITAVLDEAQSLGKLGREAVVREFKWKDTVIKTTEKLEQLVSIDLKDGSF